MAEELKEPGLVDALHGQLAAAERFKRAAGARPATTERTAPTLPTGPAFPTGPAVLPPGPPATVDGLAQVRDAVVALHADLNAKLDRIIALLERHTPAAR